MQHVIHGDRGISWLLITGALHPSTVNVTRLILFQSFASCLLRPSQPFGSTQKVNNSQELNIIKLHSRWVINYSSCIILRSCSQVQVLEIYETLRMCLVIIRLPCSNWGLQSQRERWHLGLKHRNVHRWSRRHQSHVSYLQSIQNASARTNRVNSIKIIVTC